MPRSNFVYTFRLTASLLLAKITSNERSYGIMEPAIPATRKRSDLQTSGTKTAQLFSVRRKETTALCDDVSPSIRAALKYYVEGEFSSTRGIYRRCASAGGNVDKFRSLCIHFFPRLYFSAPETVRNYFLYLGLYQSPTAGRFSTETRKLHSCSVFAASKQQHYVLMFHLESMQLRNTMLKEHFHKRPGSIGDVRQQKACGEISVTSPRLACSPLTKAYRAESPAGPLPDFHKWKSWRTMSLVGGFSRDFPFPPAFPFRPLLHTHLDHPRRFSRPRCYEPPKSLHLRRCTCFHLTSISRCSWLNGRLWCRGVRHVLVNNRQAGLIAGAHKHIAKKRNEALSASKRTPPGRPSASDITAGNPANEVFVAETLRQQEVQRWGRAKDLPRLKPVPDSGHHRPRVRTVQKLVDDSPAAPKRRLSPLPHVTQLSDLPDTGRDLTYSNCTRTWWSATKSLPQQVYVRATARCRPATRHSFQPRRAPEVDWPLSVGDSLIRPRQTALQSCGRMVNHVARNCGAGINPVRGAGISKQSFWRMMVATMSSFVRLVQEVGFSPLGKGLESWPFQRHGFIHNLLRLPELVINHQVGNSAGGNAAYRHIRTPEDFFCLRLSAVVAEEDGWELAHRFLIRELSRSVSNSPSLPVVLFTALMLAVADCPPVGHFWRYSLLFSLVVYRLTSHNHPYSRHASTPQLGGPTLFYSRWPWPGMFACTPSNVERISVINPEYSIS
ncbi:hypothetical protein PR048_024000 [Dryococelus australis]|uniref:Uncharacterized protein n=1 Tax=Dryococelus australis TaxID=614101 RepID=A0ABQ9GVM4_9NEOP|nr:hypothetical protein PR048_024000 [Dryococelus australis]